MVAPNLIPPEFDPLDYDSLARSCVAQLMIQTQVNLGQVPRFVGAGVYALFYNHPNAIRPFANYASLNPDVPIYVGKAVPPGGRKGAALTGTGSSALYNRLREHVDSIRLVTNVHVDDFSCRFLVIKPVWITLAERFLISEYQPIWNVCVDGFGNHDPGSGRHQGQISWWDALHPGRPWALNLQQTKTHQQAIQKLLSC